MHLTPVSYNRTLCTYIGRSRRVFMNFAVWEHCASDIETVRLFDTEEFMYYSNLIIIATWRRSWDQQMLDRLWGTWVWLSIVIASFVNSLFNLIMNNLCNWDEKQFKKYNTQK